MRVMMDVSPSCYEEGYYRAECTVCDYKKIESRPILGHTYTTVIEETETHVVLACIRCGEQTTEESGRRSLLTLASHPIVTAVLIVIVLQLIAIPAILLHHRNHQKKLHEARLRRTSHYYDDEEDISEAEAEKTKK